MACGTCSGKGSRVSVSKRAAKSNNATQDVKTEKVEIIDDSCYKEYVRISSLDKKTIKIYNHIFGLQSEINERKFLMEMNKFFRTLIVKLKKGCPSEDEYAELEVYEKYIEAKYLKYFGE